MKSLSNTRWESRIRSVKAIRFHALEIRSTLLKLYEKLYESVSNDAKAKSETERFANALQSFKYLIWMVIWHNILIAINLVSKKL